MSKARPINIGDFRGGLNTTQSSAIQDNQFSKLDNFYYNSEKQLQTRLGYTPFGDELGDTISSYFFFQNDGTLDTKAVCNAGNDFYEYDETGNNWVSKKTGLTPTEPLSARAGYLTRWDYAVYKNVIYMCDGINPYASWDGTTYSEYSGQPRCRYISYLQDRIFAAGDDSNPNSLYYTDAAPVDGSTINGNVVVVGGDEEGQINGLSELNNIILAFKSTNLYSIDVSNQVARTINAQDGGFCNRSIHGVGNTIVYFSDNSVETLQQKIYTGGTSLESEPLSDDVKSLVEQIEEFQYNSGAGAYDDRNTNYYFSFDTNGDNTPDTTLVYSSLTKAWTKRNLPNLYTYGKYKTEDGAVYRLFSSGGQMYRLNNGLDDNGTTINYELETKKFDFDQPGLNKTYDYVDISGLKAVGTDIEITIKVEDDEVAVSTITDANINTMTSFKTISTSPVSENPLTGGEQADELELYRYTVRVPFYATGENISVNMSSEGGQWILEKMRVSVEQEPVDVFYTDNIL